MNPRGEASPVSFMPEAEPEDAPPPLPAQLEQRREPSFGAVCARVVHLFAEDELAPERLSLIHI